MANYEIITEWKFANSTHEIFELIKDMETWPEWWPGIKKVEKVVHGFEAGQGSLYHCILKGILPINLRFTQVLAGVKTDEIIEGNVHGNITGFLNWEFFRRNNDTIVKAHFKVHDSRAFTYYTGFLLAPLYKLNFHYLFRRGAKGLAVKLKKTTFSIPV